MTLALELASTLSRHRDQPLIIGPAAPSALEAAGLPPSPSAEHRDGAADLEEWAAAVTRPGDLLVVPIHDTSIGPPRSGCTGSGPIGARRQPEPRDLRDLW
jgi:hypothetical protein